MIDVEYIAQGTLKPLKYWVLVEYLELPRMSELPLWLFDKHRSYMDC